MSTHAEAVWLSRARAPGPECGPPTVKRYTRPTSGAWTALGEALATVDSTNLELQRRLQAAAAREAPLPVGYSLRADFQTAGRGRLGRNWESRAGENLCVSYLLDVGDLRAGQLFTVSQAVALATRTAVERLLGPRAAQHPVQVKWPNDIYVGDEKVAGLLLESVLHADRVACVVAGIGINVNQPDFVEAARATSLRLVSGCTYGTAAVWEALTRELQVAHTDLVARSHAGDTYAIQQAYHEHLFGLGAWTRYRLIDADTTVVARLVGIDARGRARLEHDGETRAYDLDEVRWEGSGYR